MLAERIGMRRWVFICAGLWGLAAAGLAFVDSARTFYAHQDARTPLWLAGLTLLVYVGVGALLIRTPLGFAGLALGVLILEWLLYLRRIRV